MPVLLLVLALVGCKTGADDPKPVDDTDDTDVDVDTRPDDTDPPEPDPEPAQTALDDLRDASTGPVTLHAEAGVVNALFATVPVDPGPPIDQALGFLEEYADLYALADPRGQLHPQRADVDEEDEDGAAHVRFMQRSLPDHGSLPVFNAGLTVHVANDTVYLTTGRYLPEVLPQPPRLSWDEALRGARFTPAIGEPEVRGEPRLGVWVRWSDVGAIGIHTVWRATISSLQADNDAPILWTVDIDAVTGNVVHVANQTTSCDRDLDIMFGFHGSSSSCWSFAATDDWFDADGELDDYSPTADHNNDGIDAFNLAHDVLGWYEGLGLCSYDDDDAEVEIVTHATIEGTIASATGICGTMQFRDDAVTLDILGHEFTHLVDYNHTDLEYEGQSGALDESFADVFGSFMDGNWTVAEGTPGGAFRSLQDPPDFGDPDHMSGSLSGDGIGLRSTTTSTDNGNVHTNSGIPNKAAWLTTVGGVHTGFDVTGIGTIRATRLYHVVHRFGMEDDARFTDARNALVGQAIYWSVVGSHNFGPEHVCSIANAWAAVGVSVSGADSDCDGTSDGSDSDDDNDGTSDANDNCPSVPNVLQADFDQDGIGDFCDPDLDGDGDLDVDDNCQWLYNPNQADADGDGRGDLCDDSDGDAILDIYDNCPSVKNWDQKNTDGDALGDACDPDIDNDGLPNGSDNCPYVASSDTTDTDADGVGDICDNCPTTPNPDQSDCDRDGIGSACDDPLEFIACLDFYFEEVAEFVHPLDEVSLPHVAVYDDIALPDDYRLELTVVGTGDPWVVVDQRGAVVARSEGSLTTGRARTATWKPTLDYHYPEAGVRAPFATTYQISAPPGSRGGDVTIELKGATR
jgi:hypothetical protein